MSAADLVADLMGRRTVRLTRSRSTGTHTITINWPDGDVQHTFGPPVLDATDAETTAASVALAVGGLAVVRKEIP